LQLQEPESPEADFVDYRLEGGALGCSDVSRRYPPIRFHDLRHTAATLLLGQNVHPKVVQERLGHSQISVTMDTYSHVMPSMQRDAADKLDAMFGG